MERTQIFDLMGELKLYGMRAAFDEIMATAVKRQHETVKSIAGALRDTWEIAVEEVVGHVIRRLSNEVKTPGLVKLTAITIADCEAMRDAFGRCSELLHVRRQHQWHRFEVVI